MALTSLVMDEVKYNIITCLDFPSLELSCTVKWYGPNQDIKFPVYLPENVSKIISENLIGNLSFGSCISADLVKVPDIAMSAEKGWTGVMTEQDWIDTNTRIVHIEGSFRVYAAGVGYVCSNIEHRFNVECIDGMIYL